MPDTVIDESIPEPAPEDYEAAAAAIRAEAENPAEDTPDETGDQPPNRKARYRIRAKEAESARDALAARLDTLQRNEIQRLAADRLTDPADVWRDGAAVADMLDNDGNIDTKKVDTLISGLTTKHPHWISARSPQLGSRSGSGAGTQNGHRQASWADALNSPRREQ